MKENNLISNYVQNNELKMEEIMKNYTPYLYTMIKNKSAKLPQEDIEEIISDAFVVVWKNQTKLNKNKEMRSYLVGVVRNLYNKKIRSLKNSLDIENYSNYLFEADTMDLVVENKEKEKIIVMTINNMKDEDKSIFTFYYYNGKSIKEIANILKISEKKVKSRLFRIRRKIKKNLKNRGYEYHG